MLIHVYIYICLIIYTHIMYMCVYVLPMLLYQMMRLHETQGFLKPPTCNSNLPGLQSKTPWSKEWWALSSFRSTWVKDQGWSVMFFVWRVRTLPPSSSSTSHSVERWGVTSWGMEFVWVRRFLSSPVTIVFPRHAINLGENEQDK